MRTTKINVLGTTYTVVMGTREEVGLSKDLVGTCDIYNKKICVFYGELEEDEPGGIAEIRAKEIIQHELVHAYIKECGIVLPYEAEEVVCTFLESNLRKLMNSALTVMEDFNLE